MSRSTASRQLASRLFTTTTNSTWAGARCAITQFAQPFSTSKTRRDDDGTLKRENLLSGLVGNPRNNSTTTKTRSPPPAKSESMLALSQQKLKTNPAQVAMGLAVNDSRYVDILRDPSQSVDILGSAIGGDRTKRSSEPYHFHIYSHKHNCHVTVTKPNRDAIVSLSCGNLGFRHSQRKTYDSAYQLGAYVIDKLQQAGWHNKIDRMEVSLRGYGPGREAVTKVLLGTEGKLLRDKIVKVSDSTRLKFGGTRSKRPRRLG